MARAESPAEENKTFTLLLLVVVIAGLYFAREVLVPLALAALLTFVLAPICYRLERLKLGRVPAILLTVTAAFFVLAGLVWVMAGQMVDLAQSLPKYQDNLVEKIRSIKKTDTGVFAKVESAVERLGKEITGTPAGAASRPADAQGKSATAPPTPPLLAPADRLEVQMLENKPIPVEIVTRSTPFGIVSDLLPGVLGSLGTVGIVLVFAIFMLLAREDLRNRLIRLIGPDQITVTTQALDDAAQRVSRYLRAQLIINAGYGVAVAAGLYFIGLPNAILWGLLSGLLRYIPYVGPWMGAVAAILLSLAVFDGWTAPLMTIGLFVVAELVVNNVFEPMLYNTSTGVSTIGILVSAVFWTWLWGAVGLVMSTPLTVCIAVIGRYVPQMAFLNILLADEPALPPGARLYQRLLVGDEDEARSLVDNYIKEHSLDALFENVLLPALILTEQDSQRGVLELNRREFIVENLRDLIDELSESAAPPALVAVEGATTDGAPAEAHKIVILPARDLADELAAQMLVVRLKARGIDAEVYASSMLTGEAVEAVAQGDVALAVISAVPPFAARHARLWCKRLRSRSSTLPILVGVWSDRPADEPSLERMRAAGADKSVSRLSQAVEYIERQFPSRLRVETPPAVVVEAAGARDAVRPV